MVPKPVFYRNHGYQCGQAAMRSALSCLSDDKFSYSLLDSLTGRIGDKWTYLVQIAKALLDLNFEFEYFASRSDLEKMLGIDIMKGVSDFCGGNTRIAGATDENAVKLSIKRVLASDSVVEEIPSLDFLAGCITKNYANICCIDNSFIFKSESYHGHHVVVTWIGGYNVYYHDSGPDTAMPDRKVRKEVFDKAWKALHWFDKGLIVIKGRQFCS